MNDAPQEQPQQIMPQPVPTSYAVNSLQGPDGTPLVVLQVQTPVGFAVYFMSRDDALGLASILKQQAQQGPKLVTPPSGLVVPGR